MPARLRAALFPSLVCRVSEKKSAKKKKKKIGEKSKSAPRGRGRSQFSHGADLFLSPNFFFRWRNGLSCERGTARSLYACRRTRDIL